MGEMSDYFEDFPEENPGNYVGDRFDPQGAARLRKSKAKVEQETADLKGTIAHMIAEGQERAKAKNPPPSK
jgi:hypothetical protein